MIHIGLPWTSRWIPRACDHAKINRDENNASRGKFNCSTRKEFRAERDWSERKRGGEGNENAFIFIRVPRKIFWQTSPPLPPQPESVSTDRHVQVILIVYNFANESRTILSITTLWKARSIYRSSRLLSHLETRKFSNLSTLILCFLKRIETRRLDLLRVIDTPRREELPLRFFPRFVRRKWGKEGRPGWR